MQIENMTDIISTACSNFLKSESENENSNLEICDEEVEAMMAECDKHYDVSGYCIDKIDFMTDYISERNLSEDSPGKIASLSPK